MTSLADRFFVCFLLLWTFYPAVGDESIWSPCETAYLYGISHIYAEAFYIGAGANCSRKTEVFSEEPSMDLRTVPEPGLVTGGTGTGNRRPC